MTPRNRIQLSGSRFTPAKIPGLALWFDASRITGLVDTDPVTQWNDLSRNVANAAQATSAKKPAYRTNQVNGYPAVSFDGTDDFLSISAGALFKNIGVCTVYAVTASPAISTDRRIFETSAGAGTSSRMLSGRGRGGATNTVGAGGRRLDADSFAETNSDINAFVADTWGVQTAVFDYNNSDVFAYLNGSLVASNLSFQTDGLTSNTASATCAIGAVSIGNAVFYSGKIAELIVAVDKTARTRTEKYLAAKYGITLIP